MLLYSCSQVAGKVRGHVCCPSTDESVYPRVCHLAFDGQSAASVADSTMPREVTPMPLHCDVLWRKLISSPIVSRSLQKRGVTHNVGLHLSLHSRLLWACEAAP